MAKIVSMTEHFQHFLTNLKESFWGDLEQKTQLAWKRFLEEESERERDRYAVLDSYERGPRRPGQYRNGYYWRELVTRFGTIRLRIARVRGKSFLPRAIEKFQRRAPELALLIREAFLRGISTRQVGRIVATITGETVSAQTVSRLTRDLDEAVKQFHQAPLKDEWAYLFLDGVNLKVRRPAGRQCVQMLVAYGVRQDKRRELLAFLRTKGESQADWEALLQDLYRRGLKGDKLLLIVTDGCPGLAAAIQTVYPRVAHQRCWVHKMRNILDKVRKRDHDAVKADAQAIYLAEGRRQAEAAARTFCRRWRREYPTMVRQLERDLPDLLAFFVFPNTCGASCAPPTSLNAASSKYVEEPAPWSASSTCSPWTASSTPFSRDSIWNGKTAPSAYLHKQLDVTLCTPRLLLQQPYANLDFCAEYARNGSVFVRYFDPPWCLPRVG